MPAATFIETREYRKFAEFCDDCRRYRYIGLCYGPPGVGKTLSARHYTKWDKVESCKRSDSGKKGLNVHSAFYTAPVVNSAGQIRTDILVLRERLRYLSVDMRELERTMDKRLSKAREQERKAEAYFLENRDWLNRRANLPSSGPTVAELTVERSRRSDKITDPVRLIVVDEADRMKMPALEQLRAIFDEGGAGLILIGMPGLEKRLARYPQLYSRVGFVHEFRALQQTEILQLLREQWRPRGPGRSDNPWADDEGIAAIVRVTGGNFRLLDRLLTQIERVLRINKLGQVTRDVVEAARESLVIGVE
jgi:DNA transposition AAA+ family ATPase